MATLPPMLAFRDRTFAEMLGQAYDDYPPEACGSVLGGGGNRVLRFVAVPTRRGSARAYTIPPEVALRAERAAEDDGLEIMGVLHSHTHARRTPAPRTSSRRPTPAGTTSS